MWEGSTSQDVGLELAIIKESVIAHWVESACAEDVNGAKLYTEAAAYVPWGMWGRGAFCKPLKVMSGLLEVSSANADMSNDKGSEKLLAGRPRVPVNVNPRGKVSRLLKARPKAGRWETG